MGFNTILLKGEFGRQYNEGRASGNITPGHLIKVVSGGTLQVHATAGGFSEKTFAVEDSLGAPVTSVQGKTIDTVYASGDLVRYIVAERGDIIYALLPAGAAAIVEGDALISNGDGCLKKTTGTPSQVIAYATEAIDNSGGSDPVRIKARVA